MKKKQPRKKKSAAKPDDRDHSLRDHVLYLLRGGGAHLSFEKAVADLPAQLRGARAPGVPHTPWQLLEHMRICQWDILDFSRNSAYRELEFSAYWPPTQAPPSEKAWEESLRAFRADLAALKKLVADPRTDLFPR